jgi:molecular chaperone GrpE
MKWLDKNMKKHKQQIENNAELESLQAQLIESDTKWKRALADYQNLEKRTAEQKSLYIRLATVSLIEKMIQIADDLGRASDHLKDKGLEMIVGRLNEVLKEEGLQEIDVANADFDPLTMECVEVVAGEKDKVVKVSQKGYRLYDTIIRPAKVEVGNGEGIKPAENT